MALAGQVGGFYRREMYRGELLTLPCSFLSSALGRQPRLAHVAPLLPLRSLSPHPFQPVRHGPPCIRAGQTEIALVWSRPAFDIAGPLFWMCVRVFQCTYLPRTTNYSLRYSALLVWDICDSIIQSAHYNNLYNASGRRIRPSLPP